MSTLKLRKIYLSISRNCGYMIQITLVDEISTQLETCIKNALYNKKIGKLPKYTRFEKLKHKLHVQFP